VVTVFAGAPEPPVTGFWDEVCGFVDSAEGIEIRRAEETAALSAGGHRLTFLPLLEDQYSGGRGADERGQIVTAVYAWAATHPGGFVALPAGAGWIAPAPIRVLLRALARPRVRPHPDHVFVRDAVLEGLTNGATWAPLLYEEYPYSLGGGAAGQVSRLASRLDRRAVELELPVDRGAKARRIAHYASQVGLISPPGGRLDDPSSLMAIERYWLLER
jgi:hypothetical protein